MDSVVAVGQKTDCESREASFGGSLEKRNKIILEHLPLVNFIASRIASRLPSRIELGDLINSGIIGLIDAIEKFDPTRKIKFKTYAEFRIKGAILDELRAFDWVLRSVRQAQGQITRAVKEIEQEKGGPVKVEDIAGKLKLSVEETVIMMAENTPVIISLDEPLFYRDDGEDAMLVADIVPDPSENARDRQIFLQHKAFVLEAIKHMPKGEQIVLSLYYFGDLTMTRIGDIMGVTESRVSQIHIKAINRLIGRLLEKLGRDSLRDSADIASQIANNLSLAQEGVKK